MWWVGGGGGRGVALGSFSSSFIASMLYIRFSYVYTTQIVNEDIEAIESTIPRLESFNASYAAITSAVVSCGERLGVFSTSATSSGGVRTKRDALKVCTL